MATRRGQQQPFRKGTARQPGAALSAALRGKAAPGVASATNVAEQQRALASNAAQKQKAANSLAAELTKKAGLNGNRTIPKPQPGPVSSKAATPNPEKGRTVVNNTPAMGQDSLGRALTAPKAPAKGVNRPTGPRKGNGTTATGTAPATPMPDGKRRSLARDIQQGKDRAPVKGSPQLQKRAYLNGGNATKNTTGNARNGQEYREFTKEGKAGVYHEYIDPVTKKRRVVRVKGAVQTA